MVTGGHFESPIWAILDDRKSLSIAISDQYATFLFTKWLPAAILDDLKSLSMTFLAISDQCTTFNLFSQNGCRRPFWMNENHFRSHFSLFQINTQHFIFFFFHKMASIRNFLFCFTKWLPLAILDDRKSLLIAFQIKTQLCFFFLAKWPPAATLDDRKSLVIALLAISDQYTIFFSKWRPAAILEVQFGPFWMIENRRNQNYNTAEISNFGDIVTVIARHVYSSIVSW